MSNPDNQPQLTQAEYEAVLKEKTEKYNAEIEKYNEEKDELHSLERANHSLLKKLYNDLRNGRNNNPNSNEYEQSCIELEDVKNKLFDRQGHCLVLLQKVRNLQNNYLVSIINGLQAQLKEVHEEHPSSVNQSRQNNLD